MTDPVVAVRRVRPADRDRFVALRLEALRSDPEAFGSTYARDAERPAEWWDGVIARGAGADREAVYIAARDDALVGMAGIFPDGDELVVWGMWVRGTERGRGTGGRLLDALLGWVDARRPPASARLSVNPGQAAAVGLYIARGFRATGQTEPLEHTPSVQLIEMVRPPPGRAGTGTATTP